MKATLADVSRLAGVSTATVSRVINGSDLVGAATRKLVETAIQELDYVPSHAARVLAGKASNTLAVVFPRVQSGFYAEILTGLYEVAAEGGFNLMTVVARNDDPMLIRNLRDGRCAALIVLNLNLPAGVAGQLAHGDLPVVAINRQLDGKGISMVGLDNIAGIRLMMDHLVNTRSFRDIAVLSGPDDNADTRSRLTEFAASAARLGVDAGTIWPGDFTEEGGYNVMAAHLEAGHPLPEVLFAHNDNMAYGAMLALRSRNLRVPDDLAIVGFDDLPTSRVVGLTTINGSAREQGREACRLAMSLVDDNSMVATRILAPELVVRDSCRPTA